MKGFEQVKKEELKDLLEDDELLSLFENGEIVEDFEVQDRDATKRNYPDDLIIN